jgi:hypothetical protein
MGGTRSHDLAGGHVTAAICKPGPDPQRPPCCEPFVLRGTRFARISAVEGIALTDERRAMLDGFNRQGMSARARRRAILQSFKNAPSTTANLAEAIRRRLGFPRK